MPLNTQTHTHTCMYRYIKNLVSMKGADKHCVFAARTDDANTPYILIVLNAIGR